MNSSSSGLRLASVIVGLIAAAQAARLVFRPQIVVNGWELPLWPSALAAIILAALCRWLWRLAAELADRGGNQLHSP